VRQTGNGGRRREDGCRRQHRGRRWSRNTGPNGARRTNGHRREHLRPREHRQRRRTWYVVPEPVGQRPGRLGLVTRNAHARLDQAAHPLDRVVEGEAAMPGQVLDRPAAVDGAGDGPLFPGQDGWGPLRSRSWTGVVRARL
jgi:hypothetical protein